MASIRDVLRVEPGSRANLASIDPASTPGLPKQAGLPRQGGRDPKAWSRERLVAIGEDLASLQELQAMDCGGKDGTTKKVAGTMNPQGLQIVSFGPPTAEERSHDFLWRIRRALPPA